jgi:outer membrane protein TolC
VTFGIVAGIALAVVPTFAGLSLADAMTRTVANSASVATAQAAVRERQADLRLARRGGIPHLTGDYSLAPQAAPTGSSTVEQHFITVGAGVSINDILANSAATRVAAADLLAAQRTADAAALGARSTAVGAYFAALQAIAIQTVREAAVRGAQRGLAAADVRARTGESPRLDVLRAEVSLAQAQADRARAQADRANAVDALASATNLDASGLSRIDDRAAERPTATAPLDERRAVARALASRPEVAALLASIAARTGDVTLARRAAWPTLTAGAGFQRGVDTAVPVHGPEASVHLDFPLSPGTSDRVAIAQVHVDAARIQLLEARRTIALEVAAAVRTARAAQAAERAAERARDAAQQALSAVELGYREGASSSLDVAEARRAAVQASVDALVARYQRAQAQALLEVLVP